MTEKDLTSQAEGADAAISGLSRQELVRRLSRLQRVLSVATVINSTLDLDRLLELGMVVAREVMDAEASSLMLAEEGSGDLVFEVATGSVGDQVKAKYRIPRGQGIAGWVAQEGKPALVRDAYDDPRFNPDFDRETGFRTRSVLCIPLRDKGRLIGVASVLNKRGEAGEHLVFEEEDVDIFGLLCDQLAVAIENAKLHAAVLARQRLERDLELAQTIQQSFLPQSYPETPGLVLAARNEPAQSIGGDMYDFFRICERDLAVVIGDVSGKGISAALYMARLVSDLRHAAAASPDPGDVLAALNDALVPRSTRGMFVTLTYMLINLETREFRYASAGHHPILRRRVDGDISYLSTRGGTPLGIVPRAVFPVETATMEEGDLLLMFTDGIVEATSNAEEMFGYARLEEQVKNNPPHPTILIGRLVDAVRSYAGMERMLDDITAVGVATAPRGRMP